MNALIVVESPTKVKTLGKYLGKDYQIKASVGHIKDLPKNTLGIDLGKSFEPTYTVLDEKKKVVAELKKAAAKADKILLAPDPDREGEAIAWHIAEEIGQKKTVQRVLFNDLTKETVLNALKHPRDLNFDLYEAQQTRRILDRLVGYKISPLLWEKVKRGLSAGRVQSVALRIICDREEEIKRFVPEEYWNIIAVLEGKNPPSFEAKLIKVDGKKAKIPNGESASRLVEALKKADFAVASIEKKEVKRRPPAPFTTSTLQQEASRWLHFGVKKTMATAQRLYEGIEIGEAGQVGLITYMRTDSVRVASEAINEARQYIQSTYGRPYLPSKPVAFKVKEAAQDAHEAIRPTSVLRRPDEIKGHLSQDQYRLYQLIWNRFVASQMNPAVFDQTTVDIGAANCIFRAQGSVMKFDGFTVLYTEGKEENSNDKEFGKIIPELLKGEILNLLSITPEQKFTQPPPRFSEASLVRELEENGIGRPSTYATIIGTLQEREYVTMEKQKFIPTDLGFLVTALLVKNFPRILDVAFTARMESELDLIAEGKEKRLTILNTFYTPFADELRKAQATMRNVKREEIPTDIVCEKCGSPMVVKWGRNGRFLACSNYPACKNTMNFTEDADGKIIPIKGSSPDKTTQIPTDIVCEKCGSPMVVKWGRNGRFLACSNYPACKNTMNFTEDADGKIIPVQKPGKKAPVITDILCEKCGRPMAIREGRYGKFLACTGYPKCKNIKKYVEPKEDKG